MGKSVRSKSKSLTKEFRFEEIYDLVHLTDSSVTYEIGFWNYDEDFFKDASAFFSQKTLLHQYILTNAINHHRRDFGKIGDCIEDDNFDSWAHLFRSYSIRIKRPKKADYEDLVVWFDTNIEAFIELFERMTEEAFHVLFANRNFLLRFNKLVAEQIKETEYPRTTLTAKGTLKRRAIPEWAKKAVYHRDKGRCVFCNTDLTYLINTLNQSNLDHMVPLDKFGSNDPCNIQLTCERCNKSKRAKDASTSNQYFPWW